MGDEMLERLRRRRAVAAVNSSIVPGIRRQAADYRRGHPGRRGIKALRTVSARPPSTLSTRARELAGSIPLDK
jgi:hypothetical protein